MKNGMNSSGIGFGGSSGGGGTKPEQTVNLTTGQRITIAGKEYTVIENVQGNQYKMLANELANNGSEMWFGSSEDYQTSWVATYLDNDYYNSLDASIKNAIVPTSIQQKESSTSYDDGANSPTWTGEIKDAGIHKVFLPSWDELTKAAGGTDKETLKTFLNSKYVWLRDIYGGGVLSVYEGFLFSSFPNYDYYVRPALVLDFSKVEYTTK